MIGVESDTACSPLLVPDPSLHALYKQASAVEKRTAAVLLRLPACL